MLTVIIINPFTVTKVWIWSVSHITAQWTVSI